MSDRSAAPIVPVQREENLVFQEMTEKLRRGTLGTTRRGKSQVLLFQMSKEYPARGHHPDIRHSVILAEASQAEKILVRIRTGEPRVAEILLQAQIQG